MAAHFSAPTWRAPETAAGWRAAVPGVTEPDTAEGTWPAEQQGVGLLGLILGLSHWTHHLLGFLFLVQKIKGLTEQMSAGPLGFYGRTPRFYNLATHLFMQLNYL